MESKQKRKTTSTEKLQHSQKIPDLKNMGIKSRNPPAKMTGNLNLNLNLDTEPETTRKGAKSAQAKEQPRRKERARQQDKKNNRTQQQQQPTTSRRKRSDEQSRPRQPKQPRQRTQQEEATTSRPHHHQARDRANSPLGKPKKPVCHRTCKHKGKQGKVAEPTNANAETTRGQKKTK